NIEMVQRLAKNPMEEAEVTEPVSERITTAAGDFMGKPSRPGSLRLLMSSAVRKITSEGVVIKLVDGTEKNFPNDVVFTMIGREAPLNFFRRSGIRITNEWTKGRLI